jgi:predicted glutamine amidotransferase
LEDSGYGREGSSICGIAGIRKFGDEVINETQIRLFLTGMEHRGNDATGIAMQKKDGEILILKDDIAAWNFTKSKKYEEFINENLNEDIIQVILHTRAATKGSPRKNPNNHPLSVGKCAVIHNGVISNDDSLFRELDLERGAETDSDILRAIVDKHGITKDAIKHLNKVRGGVAMAAMHPEYPGMMLLGRSGNPMTMASDENFLVFASEKSVIHRAMRPWVFRFKKWFQVQSLQLAFSGYPDHSIEILGTEGTEWHDEFRTHYGTYNEPVRRVYTGWKERQKKWDSDNKPVTQVKTLAKKDAFLPLSQLNAYPDKPIRRITECPSCKLRLALLPEQVELPLWELSCPKDNGGCGKLLGRPPVYEDVQEKVVIN